MSPSSRRFPCQAIVSSGAVAFRVDSWWVGHHCVDSAGVIHQQQVISQREALDHPFARRIHAAPEHEFREALDIQPNYADAHANLGAALISTDTAAAVRELEKAVSLAPGMLKAQFNLAMAYGADPNYGPAKEIDQLRKVLVAEPTFARARLALGKELLREGRLEQSIAELQEAVRVDSQNTAAHYQLGLALSRAGQSDEAAAELQKSRDLAATDDRKQNADLDIAEGHVALDKGELDQAAAKFRHALVLQPESSDAQHFLAAVLEKQGDTEGASAAYRKTLELNPGDLSAREKTETFSVETRDHPEVRCLG